MSKWTFCAVLALALAVVPVYAYAKCGTGQPIDYDDIEAVMFKSGYQDWGHGEKWQSWTKAHKFQDSAFYLFFWQITSTRYVQYDLKGSIGTYTLAATINNARDLLRKDKFYSISNRYADWLVTDTPMSVVTVLRCDVITRLMVYANPNVQEPAVRKLLDDLRAFIVKSKKTKISNEPRDFEYELFDY